MKAFVRMLVTALFVVAGFGSAFALDVPALTGRVVDNAGVLKAGERQELESALRAIEEKTSAQIVILTVKSMEGEDPTDWSQTVFRTWKLGQADKNNGLLIFLTVAERKIRIHTGYGLEGPIPDAEAWSIIRRTMAPQLRKGSENYFAALKDGVARVGQLITGEVKPGERPLSPSDKTNSGALLLFLIPLLLAALACEFHPVAGGVVNGAGAAGIAWLLFGMNVAAIALVIGFLIGLVAQFVLQMLLHVGLSGGGGGGFSGGGGSSAGGGAIGDF
ncbi:hypothetical protein A2765_01465 [Candidatus Kaiserbacteria bacterium RIFCSPHIGHO2_01_FULL_56_24]|uniref:TPM domain-containing protein n=1 Tax=Candidatus Kaiserbacteria bacterium RIFCSPHIGHO2_01_FULL_56_24 TaxID=1798487 RepID=A0A1F6DH75_9BACT|nr:MAG: hypothetical protein A2765_01465 [Candidatus Kaiserbacteria bacterium RIFCSPHIGHO2_01_FULL_56_24]